MFFAIIIILGLFLAYLIVKEARENKKSKLNINRGWKVTPYLNLRISSFENRMDLEKMRLKEVIKNTIKLTDGNAKFIDSNKDCFYIESKNELIHLEFVGHKEVKYIGNLNTSLKKNEIIGLELYDLIKKVLGKYIWVWEEELKESLISEFHIRFSIGYISLKVTKESKMKFNKDNNIIKK